MTKYQHQLNVKSSRPFCDNLIRQQRVQFLERHGHFHIEIVLRICCSGLPFSVMSYLEKGEYTIASLGEIKK